MTAVRTHIDYIEPTCPNHAWERLSTKADKVKGATAGHIAVLDEHGNLVDGGQYPREIFAYKVVDELPEASEETMYCLYFVPSSNPGEENVKDEFITVRDGEEGAYTYAWEQIGSTEIDLSDYYTKTQVDTKLSKKLNTAEGLTVTDGGGETDSEVELQEHDGGSEKVTLTPQGVTVSDTSETGIVSATYKRSTIELQGEEPGDSYVLTLPAKDGTIATTGDVNAKYTKPSGGIPASDMTSEVQTSLGKADTALQPVQGVSLQTGAVHTLGSSIDDDASLDAQGVHIYDENGDTHYKRGKIVNDSQEISLPTSAGTFALTSQIPDVSRKVNGTGITTVRSISQADYENLGTYDASTLYVIY